MTNWTIRDRTLRVSVPPHPPDGDVIIRAVRQAIEDPGFVAGLDLLIDARGYDGNQPSVEIPAVELRSRAAAISRLGFKNCALVVAPVPVRRGLANMFAAFAEEHGLHTGVFEDVSRAEAWLAHSPEIHDPLP
jgi:hypothetical protein